MSHRLRHFHRLNAGLLYAIAGCAFAAAAEIQTVPGVVELPKFHVTGDRILPEPEAWRYARIPGFEILSNASDRDTRRLIGDFQLFRQAVGIVWRIPEPSVAVPAMLVICGRASKFRDFLPNTDDEKAPDQGRASLFLQGAGHHAIVLDFQSKTLLLSLYEQESAGDESTDFPTFSVDHYRQLYREHVHYLLSRTQPRSAAWIEEGLAQIIMAMKFDRTSIIFGRIEDPNLVSPEAAIIAARLAAFAEAAGEPGEDFSMAAAPVEDRDFNFVLRQRSLLSFEQLFAVTHDSPVALNVLGNNRWAKQCYAFVHMCLYGRGKRYQPGFLQLLARSGTEPISEAMFKEHLGRSYKQMLTELRGYILTTDHQYERFRVRGGKLPEPPPLELRDATPAEVGRIKGETMLLAGRNDDARNEFIAPYYRHEYDGPLLASLGLLEHTAGEEARARQFLEAAAREKVVRPRAYLELARLRLAEALARPAGPDGLLDEKQHRHVLDPLAIALTQPPQMPEVYELIVDTWAHSAVELTPDTFKVIDLGAKKFFPKHVDLIYKAAALLANRGFTTNAASYIQHGLKIAPDAATAEPFARLQAALPQARAEACPPE